MISSKTGRFWAEVVPISFRSAKARYFGLNDAALGWKIYEGTEAEIHQIIERQLAELEAASGEQWRARIER